MKKLDEISINAKKLYEDIKDLEESTKKETSKDIDFNYFKGLAKQNAFKEHILKDESEYVQKTYLHLISSLLMFSNQDEVKHSQILYISRLIEGFENKNLDIENIYSHTMVMNGVQISECIEVIKDYKDVFVVDSLICANIKGKANDHILEYLSEIYSIMGIKADKFKELISLCNIILENKSSKILEIEDRNIGRYSHHISKMFREKVFYDLEDISENETGDIILLNYSLDMRYRDLKSKLEILYKDSEDYKIENAMGNIVIYNDKFNTDINYYFNTKFIENLSLDEGYINLDKYLFNKISFINCKFNGIVGIKSENKNLKFINCIIENIKDNYIYYEKEYISTQIITPINLKNCSFIKCKIKNLKNTDMEGVKEEGYSMAIFDKCTFKDVDFIDCEMFCTYLAERDVSIIKFYNSKVENCRFLNIKAYRGCEIIEIKNSKMNKNIFQNCYLLNTRVSSDFIKANNSNIINNTFENCHGQMGSDSRGRKISAGYIFELTNRSIEQDNKFINCNFHHQIKN